MRIFPLLLMLLVMFHTGIVFAEEESDVVPDDQILLNNSNVSDAPPIDEYNNVPPGILMSEGPITPTDPITHQDTPDVMTIDDITAAYDRAQYDIVIKHITPIADNNYPQAEELLGIMYLKGQGVPQDSETAVTWLRKAANADRPIAQHYMATLTYTGNGTQQDPVEGLMWLYIAIAHYSDGPEKTRAIADRNALASHLSRRERLRAFELARDWLKKKDEDALFDQVPPQ
jgi:hypothetical protein